MEGGSHGQMVRRETGIGAHLCGAGSFRRGAEEDVVKGTCEALRAHPRGDLSKGAQTAHPEGRERAWDEVAE